MRAVHFVPDRRRRKFGNTKGATVAGVDGAFDSKKEAKRAQQLILLEKAGEIQKLRRQVKFELIPACREERPAYYTADFTYYEPDGDLWAFIVEDCKSEITRKQTDYVLRRKLMNWRHAIQVRET